MLPPAPHSAASSFSAHPAEETIPAPIQPKIRYRPRTFPAHPPRGVAVKVRWRGQNVAIKCRLQLQDVQPSSGGADDMATGRLGRYHMYDMSDDDHATVGRAVPAQVPAVDERDVLVDVA